MHKCFISPSLSQFVIAQQLAQLVVPGVHSVNSLGQVPVFHYGIIGHHGGPSLSPFALAKREVKSLLISCLNLWSITPNQAPGMKQGETGDKGYLTDYVVGINHNTGGKRREQHHNRPASEVPPLIRHWKLHQTAKESLFADSSAR